MSIEETIESMPADQLEAEPDQERRPRGRTEGSNEIDLDDQAIRWIVRKLRKGWGIHRIQRKAKEVHAENKSPSPGQIRRIERLRRRRLAELNAE
jgi:hypothetical protein